jgi:cellulose synthase/poly-beta-1,6-N-acetylglucosamine synthase-like glycosyltransferase
MVHKSFDDMLIEAPRNTASAPNRTRRARQSDETSLATRRIRANYRRASEIAGPLTDPHREKSTVRFRYVTSVAEQAFIILFVLAGFVFSLRFLAILLHPKHNPMHLDHANLAGLIAAWCAYLLLILLEALRWVQSSTLGLFALSMRDPVPMVPEPGLRIAVLTTIVPDKEPIELVAKTLKAMRKLTYSGLVDVWILDEGNDPEVRHLAATLGVYHFSRKGRPEYNRLIGAYRRRCKAGNHNAWRAEHEADYGIVAQMDPDHLPSPAFLVRTLGYFRDPDVAFVVAPQVYGNQADMFVTGGAADQSYVFHGVLQRGGNRLGAPLLIGTNHLYRVSAWRQIAGYQDSVIEDHLTSMHIHTTKNPRTGQYWKGIYTPDVLSIGEGPGSWTDYFNQQYRWAYGIWEILFRHTPKLVRNMPRTRALSYICHQSYYPSIAALWWAGPFITALYLVFGVSAIDMSWSTWLSGWLPAVVPHVGFFIYLRRFNLVAHERRGIGLAGMLLTQAAGPIYAFAALGAVLRSRYSYIVTAKAGKVSVDRFATFQRNSYWAAAALFMLVASRTFHHRYGMPQIWAALLVATASLPVIFFLCSAVRRRQTGRKRAKATTEFGSTMRTIEPSSPFVVHASQPVAATVMGGAAGFQHIEPALPTEWHDDGNPIQRWEPPTERLTPSGRVGANWPLVRGDIAAPR